MMHGARGVVVRVPSATLAYPFVVAWSRQRSGGKPDNSDLKKPSPFSFFSKKKEEPEQPEAPPAKNWWTLN